MFFSEGLIGVVTSALCWKANEWIGLSLACHIGDILHSLLQHNHVHQLSVAIDGWKHDTSNSCNNVLGM
jgi:hypothetical protein